MTSINELGPQQPPKRVFSVVSDERIRMADVISLPGIPKLKEPYDKDHPRLICCQRTIEPLDSKNYSVVAEYQEKRS